MKINVILGERVYEVEVSPDDPISILCKKLNKEFPSPLIICHGIPIRMDGPDSLKTFRELDLEDGENITCSEYYDGGGNMNDFANLSDEFLIKVDVSYSPNIPKWRTVGKGINLFGICKNNNCQAKGNQVIMRVKSKEYDVYNEGFMGKCPMCLKHFVLDTCCFYMCDYKCEGTYFERKKNEWVDLPGNVQKTSGGKDFYYDFNKPVRGKEGKVKYKKLILKVVSYHDYE